MKNKIRAITALVILAVFSSKCEESERKVVKEYYPSGEIKIEKQVIKDTTSDGYIKAFYQNGRLKMRGENKNGKWDGLFTFYDLSGKITEEANYINNQKNGVVKIYYANGHIESNLSYTDDRKNGKSIFYDTLDREKEIDFYEKGALLRATSFYPDGKVNRDKWTTQIKTKLDSIKVGSLFTAVVNLNNQANFKNLRFKGACIPNNILDKAQPMPSYKPGAHYLDVPFYQNFSFEEKMTSPGEYYFSGTITFNDSAGMYNWSEFTHRFVVYP